MTGSITTLGVTTVTATAGVSTAADTDDTTSTGARSEDGSTSGVADSTGTGGDGTGSTTTSDTCGNGRLDDGETCDGDALDGMACADLRGFSGGRLACAADCQFDVRGCASVATPGPGEVIVTEIMQNPSALSDAMGEWFELHNPTTGPLTLGGCDIEGNISDGGFSLPADLTIAAGAYLVLAVDTPGGPGFVPDLVWSGAAFGLNNTADMVRLICDGATVDEVAYDDGVTFPDPNGASMTLAPTAIDAGDNDVGDNWCEGSSDYFMGDFGTPGAANDDCP